MQQYRKAEMAVGVFVFIGLLSIAWLAIKVGQIGGIGASGYTLSAKCVDAGGVRKGSDIMLAGVTIGRIDEVMLTDNEKATMILRIHDGVKITTDATASIRTKGIIGDRYIRIEQGMDDTYLNPGDMIEQTNPAISIEDLVNKFVTSGGQ